jgi:hypothetical protein
MIGLVLDGIGRLLARSCLDRPVFIVGTGRSGTSVLLQALGQHPRVVPMPGEAPFLSSIGGDAALFEYADNARYYRESLTVERAYLFGQLARLGLEAAGGRHYALRQFLRAWRGRRGWHSRPSHWCAKAFPPERAARGLVLVYPHARFLYIVRNGIDVVASMSQFHGFRHLSFAEHCRAWAAGVEKYRYLEQFPHGMKLRHEDLVADPGAFFGRVYPFLGIPRDAAAETFVATSVIHPLDQPTREVSGTQAIFQARPPAWHAWTPEQREVFTSLCGVSMKECGYELPF